MGWEVFSPDSVLQASVPLPSEEAKISAQSDSESEDMDAEGSETNSLDLDIDSHSYLEVAYQLQGGIENILDQILRACGYQNLPSDAYYI